MDPPHLWFVKLIIQDYPAEINPMEVESLLKIMEGIDR